VKNGVKSTGGDTPSAIDALFTAHKARQNPNGYAAAGTTRCCPIRGCGCGEFGWPANAARLALPDTLPLRDNMDYFVEIGGKRASVTIRLIPASVSNELMLVSWMDEVGCDSQADALLARLKK
jgi:hypothetical protein